MTTLILTDGEATTLLRGLAQLDNQAAYENLGLKDFYLLRALHTRLDAQMRRAAAETQPGATMRSLVPTSKEQGYPYERSPNETVCGPTDQRCPDCGKQLEWPSDVQGTYCAECVADRLGGF